MLHSKAYLLDMGDDKAATPGQASQAHHRLLGTARGERQAGLGSISSGRRSITLSTKPKSLAASAVRK
jgi:hypothetical protein